MAAVVFLHGLESAVDEDLVPTGFKASYLRARFGAATPALDTSVAREVSARNQGVLRWTWPYEGYEEAFETPLARARAAIGPDTRLIVGSSFGGAVALRLLHEEPPWTGPVLMLAGAGPKLTPYRTLPPGVPVLLVHGSRDDVVPLEDSELLAASSPDARLIVVDDVHHLGSTVSDEMLGAWVEELLRR